LNLVRTCLNPISHFVITQIKQLNLDSRFISWFYISIVNRPPQNKLSNHFAFAWFPCRCRDSLSLPRCIYTLILILILNPIIRWGFLRHIRMPYQGSRKETEAQQGMITREGGWGRRACKRRYLRRQWNDKTWIVRTILARSIYLLCSTISCQSLFSSLFNQNQTNCHESY